MVARTGRRSGLDVELQLRLYLLLVLDLGHHDLLGLTKIDAGKMLVSWYPMPHLR